MKYVIEKMSKGDLFVLLIIIWNDEIGELVLFI